MPAVVVELGYISHPEEEKLFPDDKFPDKRARGIINGIV